MTDKKVFSDAALKEFVNDMAELGTAKIMAEAAESAMRKTLEFVIWVCHQRAARHRVLMRVDAHMGYAVRESEQIAEEMGLVLGKIDAEKAQAGKP